LEQMLGVCQSLNGELVLINKLNTIKKASSLGGSIS